MAVNVGIANMGKGCVAAGRHLHPVHLNRGRHGSIWVCLECEKQIMGKALDADEVEILVAFAQSLAKHSSKRPSETELETARKRRRRTE